MLQRMRDGAQGVLARVLVGVIIVVISAFGFGAFNIFSGRDRPVAVVNGEDISQSRFATEVEQRHRAAQGKNVDDLAIQRDALGMLIKRTLLLRESRDMKLAVSDQALTDRIAQMQAFVVDGKFSPDRFRQLLAQNGLTPASFRDNLGDDDLLDQLQRGIAGSEITVPAELQRVAALLGQKRDVAWVEVDSADFAARVQLSDADLQHYFEAHPDKFQQAESVAVNFVRLPRATIAASVAVTDAEVQAAYDAAKTASDKSPAEQRHAAHILLQVNAQRTQAQAIAQLQDVAKRVAGGASFAALATQLSEDAGSKAQGGDLGFITKGASGEAAFDAALWALRPGQLSAPVVTGAGVHLISLLEARTQQYPTFAVMQAQVRAEILQRHLNDAMSAKKAELTNDAYELDIAALAKRYKLPLQRSAFFGKSVSPNANSKDIAGNSEVVRVAFTPDVLSGDFNSPVVEVDQDLVVLKVAEHRVARAQTFTEAKPAVQAALVAERADSLARSRVAAILADVARSGDLAVSARALGVNWQTRVAAQRNGEDMPREVRAAAFALPRLASGVRTAGAPTKMPGGHLAAVVVTRILDDASGLTDADRATFGTSLRNFGGQRVFEAYLAELEAKATIDRRAVAATSPAR